MKTRNTDLCIIINLTFFETKHVDMDAIDSTIYMD